MLASATLWAGPITGITADLTSGNAALNGGSTPSPYGTVTMNLNTDGTIGVSVNMASGYDIAGGGNAFGFNDSNVGAGFTISNLTSGFTATYSSGNISSLGDFTEVINGPPASQYASSISFTISQTGGFTSLSDFLTLSTGGNPDSYFAAHVIVPGLGITGYAGSGSYTVTPEPATWLMMLTGLLGLAFVARRRWPEARNVSPGDGCQA